MSGQFDEMINAWANAMKAYLEKNAFYFSCCTTAAPEVVFCDMQKTIVGTGGELVELACLAMMLKDKGFTPKRIKALREEVLSTMDARSLLTSIPFVGGELRDSRGEQETRLVDMRDCTWTLDVDEAAELYELLGASIAADRDVLISLSKIYNGAIGDIQVHLVAEDSDGDVEPVVFVSDLTSGEDMPFAVPMDEQETDALLNSLRDFFQSVREMHARVQGDVSDSNNVADFSKWKDPNDKGPGKKH